MRAMLLEAAQQPFQSVIVPDPVPGAGQLLLQVHCCGICRTNLHIIDSELSPRTLTSKSRSTSKNQVVLWAKSTLVREYDMAQR